MPLSGVVLELATTPWIATPLDRKRLGEIGLTVTCRNVSNAASEKCSLMQPVLTLVADALRERGVLFETQIASDNALVPFLRALGMTVDHSIRARVQRSSPAAAEGRLGAQAADARDDHRR